jgi:hypothetical protein
MEAERNLHARIPAPLLIEAERVALSEQISIHELVRDAVDCRLRERRRQRVYVLWRRAARKLGIKEEDVDRLIHEFRDEGRQRIASESGH